MKVNLISHSVDVLVPGRSLIEQVAHAARVSNPANQHNDATAEKLVRYLIDHQHWSPFEMVSLCLEIETTRDIARQMLRHRSFSFQEFSQRYAVASDTATEMREARLQDFANRQNSLETDSPQLMQDWARYQQQVLDVARKAYDWALEQGIAKEVARAVLPEGLTNSRLYMSGTLRSWIHYLEVRTDASTQKEHREIAFACADAISSVFPMINKFVGGAK